jgi:hypothetical protein
MANLVLYIPPGVCYSIPSYLFFYLISISRFAYCFTFIVVLLLKSFNVIILLYFVFYSIEIKEEFSDGNTTKKLLE